MSVPTTSSGSSSSTRGSKSGRVLERGAAERVDSLADDPEVDQEPTRPLDARTGLYVPLIAARRGRSASSSPTTRRATTRASATTIYAWPKPSPHAPRSPSTCRPRVARRRAAARGRRTGARTAPLGSRAARPDRAGADLRAARPEGGRGREDDAERAEALAAVREQVVETLHDVRRLAVELRPKALDDFGLVPALERLATPSPSRRASRVDARVAAPASGCRPRSRRLSTASSRRR